MPAPTAKNSHFSVFDGYYFSCARNSQLPESSFPIGLAHCLLPDWLHQALLGSHGAWHRCSVQNTSFCSSTLAPCSSSSLVWCVWGGRGQRLETYKLSCSFGGNSPSQNSFSKEKKSLRILFENKEHSEDSITADFANTRIEINLGGQGEDSVSEVLAVQA